MHKSVERSAAVLSRSLVMVACGLANALMWLYVTLRPGLMAPEVTAAYLWARVIGTFGMPLIFLPALFLTMEQTPAILVPLAAALLLVRRVLLPRWVARQAIVTLKKGLSSRTAREWPSLASARHPSACRHRLNPDPPPPAEI